MTRNVFEILLEAAARLLEEAQASTPEPKPESADPPQPASEPEPEPPFSRGETGYRRWLVAHLRRDRNAVPPAAPHGPERRAAAVCKGERVQICRDGTRWVL
jgi:hypothetical protein